MPGGGPLKRILLAAVALVIIGATAWWVSRGPSEAPPLASPWTDPPPPRRTVSRTPNVLWVVWDTARADRASLHGHDAPTTPGMDALAESSVVFDRAIATSFWTLPTHASLFTGLPTSSHGANAKNPWLESHHVTAAEHFRDNGYDTYAWSSNPNIHSSKNTVQGFNAFQQPFGRNEFREKVETYSKTLIRDDDYSTRHHPDRWQSISHHKHGPIAVDATLAWIDQRGEPAKPFFAFVNLMEPHAYRLPTEESRRAIMPDDARYHKALVTSQLLKRMTNVMFGRWKAYFPKERAALLDAYDASIRDVDMHTTRLFDGLKERGVLDDTIVVVVGDHGEQFGEHGLWLHNFSIYDTLVHVPLLVRYPPALAPRRESRPVSVASLFATTVDLAGLPWPGAPIEPHSLAADVNYPVVSELDVPCAHPENRRLDFDIRDWTATYEAIYHDGYKYVASSNGRDELFDMINDPRETKNLWADEPDRLAKMSKMLDTWRATRPVLEITEEARERTKAEQAENADEDLMDQLEELGYVNDL